MRPNKKRKMLSPKWCLPPLILLFCCLQSVQVRAQKTYTIAGADADTVVYNTSKFTESGIAPMHTYFFGNNNIACDVSGNIYISAQNGLNYIRKISRSTGLITNFAGASATTGGTGSGVYRIGSSPTTTLFGSIGGVTADKTGNVYFTGSSANAVYKISTGGALSRLVGDDLGSSGFSGDAGLSTSARVSSPGIIASDSTGNIYFYDAGNSRIRKISTTGIITTVAGTGTAGYSGDGSTATLAKIGTIYGMACDGSGNVYLYDFDNYRIRKITISTGIITTVAGTGTNGHTGDGSAATSANIQSGYGIAFDNSGNMYFSEGTSVTGNLIRKVAAGTNIISTISSTSSSSYVEGSTISNTVPAFAKGIAFDKDGNLYTCEENNNLMKRIKVVLNTEICTRATTPTFTISGADYNSSTGQYSVCSGQSVTATIATGALNNNSNWSWYLTSSYSGLDLNYAGAVYTNSMTRYIGQGNSITYTPSSSMPGNLVVRGENGCIFPGDASGYKTVSIKTTVTPSVTISAFGSSGSNISVCSGGTNFSANVTATSGSTYTYDWKKNGTSLGITTQSAFISGLAVNDLITCAIAVSDPCQGTINKTSNTLTVTTVSGPTVNAGASQTIDAGQTVSLSGSMGGSATSVSWGSYSSLASYPFDAGDGTFDDATSLTPVYTPGPDDIARGYVYLGLFSNFSPPCGAAFDTMTLIINPPASFNITASAGSNGSISPAGNTSVTSGGNQAYTITPNSGYCVADVLVNGSSVGAVSSYTFSNVTADQTISASFVATTNWYLDADNDGYYTGAAVASCSSPGAGYKSSGLTGGGDCDDNNSSVWQSSSLYIDADNDGYDNGTATVCYGASIPSGYSTTTNGSDCNDNNSSLHATTTYYRDADGDNFGNPSVTIQACSATAPAGYTTDNTDCNDNDPLIYPKNFYLDGDKDGKGDPANFVRLCQLAPPAGYVINNADCNDADKTNAIPKTPGAISGSKKYLCDTVVTYNIVPVAKATGYHWIVPAGCTILQDNGNSIVVNLSSSFSSGTIKVSAYNGCGESAQRSLNVSSKPLKPTIAGPVCISSSATGLVYTVTVSDPDIVNYVWSGPPGIQIVSGQGTNTITVNWNRASGGILKADAYNACGSHTRDSIAVSITCASAAVAKNNIDIQAKLYPNPAGSIAYVLFNSSAGGEYNIIISDNTGKQLLTKTGAAFSGVNKVPLGLGMLTAGNYIVTLTTNDGKQSMKLIKDE